MSIKSFKFWTCKLTCKHSPCFPNCLCTPKAIYLVVLIFWMVLLKSCLFPASIIIMLPNHLCKIQKCVLTQFTRGCWISNITVRTSTNWLVSNNFAISISCTWIFFSARIDTFSIFTCGVIRTITIWCTANCKRWRFYFFYQIEKSKEVEIVGSLKG